MNERFWDRQATGYAAAAADDEDVARAVRAARAVVRARDHVLDVGCATGPVSLALGGAVASVTGIDSSRAMVDAATATAHAARLRNVTFLHGDAFHAALTPRRFSVALLFNVLHLVPDAAATLRRLHDLLSQSGRLLAATPCLRERSWWLGATLAAAHALGVAPAVARWSFADVRALFDASPFDVTASRPWDAATASWWIAARRA